MPYAWGSRTAIASLMGRPPAEEPEAELWMGAHPALPSRVARDGGPLEGLDTVIARDPERELGPRVVDELGPRLPFLLKVLAASEPLSLQAHPDAARARRGYEEEEARGVPRDAPHRNYKDASHKPELLCALGPFEALSGFRRPDAALRLLESFRVPELEPVTRPLRDSPDKAGLAATFRTLMTLSSEARANLVHAVVERCRTVPDDGVLGAAARLVSRLQALYSGDVGVVGALLLEPVHLEPGEAIYLGPGNLHAYLEGTGVEIMASSDNVLRGGLTKKHVDVPELLDALDFGSGPLGPLRPRSEPDGCEEVYDTPAREFRLSRLRLEPGKHVTRAVDGPEILFVAEGRPSANGIRVDRGQAVFVPASDRRIELRAEDGPATVYRARTNL
jgi:mannose-6-phosphate isomerase